MSDRQSWSGNDVGKRLTTGYEKYFINAFYNVEGHRFTPVSIDVELGGPVTGALVMKHGSEDVGGSMIIFGYMWNRPIFCKINNHQIITEYFL